MADIKSFDVYSPFPQYSDPSVQAGRIRAPRNTPPQCIVLEPTSEADSNALGVALLFERQEDVPRRNGIGVLAVELPPPSTLGSFDTYEAVLFEPGVISFVVSLRETPEHAWAGLLGGISQPFSPEMRVVVRPADSVTGDTGPAVLTGSLAPEA